MGTSANEMNQKDFLQFIDTHRPDDFVLLDVRQPFEYEELHLPGAFHIPLPDLADRLDEVDHSKPVVVYCRTGGRSRAAASIMEGQGFVQVVSLAGGIAAYLGEPASGKMTRGITLLPHSAKTEQVLQLALVLEVNLGNFYQELAKSETGSIREALNQLAAVEEGHVRVLEKLIGRLSPKAALEGTLPDIDEDVVEGGMKAADFFPVKFESSQDAFEFAMSLEAQALDLYMRFKFQAESAPVRQVCAELAGQEQEHLRILARWLESTAH